MHKRILWSAPFLALLLTALVATRSDGKLETIEPIIPGVWFRQGDLDQFGHCNNIVIEMKDYLLVVDANYPSGAKALMADIKKVSSKPVKYVFDTHHHGDHAYGNPLWTQAGATTLAFKAVAEEMRKFEPSRWQADAARRKDVAELGLASAEPPKQTFDESPFVIEDSTRRVEFHFFGWAHTRGDGFVYLPKEQVLCTGDAVTNGPFNGMGDGYAANWPKVVKKARALAVKHVLPAHGPAGGGEILAGEEKFLTEIYDTVKKQIQSGKKLADLVELKDGAPVKAKLQLSAGVSHWVGSFYPGQIADIYQEITQGKPRGEITSTSRKPDPYGTSLLLPKLEKAPAIDGDLSEWKYVSFTDGVWDILRLRQSPWYDPAINRLTDHGNEPAIEDDLQARYYTAWDDRYFYMGAEVKDNVNDVTDPAHEPKRWYYKDAICWFVEAPRGAVARKFGEGDNAFCFVIDASKPSYGAWWRHGAPGKTYIEEPLPKGAVDYAIRMNPWGRSKGDFILEARVEMAATFAKSTPQWHKPQPGDVYGLEIVHTDPDGGDYGGHFLIYGRGDDDATWGQAVLTSPVRPVERKPK